MKGLWETLHIGTEKNPVGTAIAKRWCSCVWLFSSAHTQPYTYKRIPPSKGLSGTFYLLSKWVPSTNPPIRLPFMFYRLINLTGFTCSIGCRPVCVCPVMTMCACMLPGCVCAVRIVYECVSVCACTCTYLAAETAWWRWAAVGPGLVSGGWGYAAAEAAASGSAAAGRPTAYRLTAVSQKTERQRVVKKLPPCYLHPLFYPFYLPTIFYSKTSAPFGTI